MMMKDVKRDLGILSYATKSIKWLYILRKVMTIGVLLFTGVEMIRLFLKNKDEFGDKIHAFFQ